MFGPTSTAGLIDEFEGRFTTANGAHFLIAPAGGEAWPISEQESAEFRARYRRRMGLARWLRRVSLILFPMLLVIGWQLPREPRWLIEAFQMLTVFALFGAPLLAFFSTRSSATSPRPGSSGRWRGVSPPGTSRR